MSAQNLTQEPEVPEYLSQQQAGETGAVSAPAPTATSLHALDVQEKGSMSMKRRLVFPILAGVVVVAGIGTGVGMAKIQEKTGGSVSLGSSQPMQQVAEGNVSAGDIFGVKDEKTFKDNAEGYLEAGGLDGEGSHSLLREGGASQTVYLTSSVTDLDKFVGMKVKVWGETFKAQKAGWLMDVGRVQIVDPQAQPPATEE